MKKILFITFLLVSGSAFSANNVQFIDGWIKQLPPVVPMRAGYMQIKNHSSTAQQIVSLQSSSFETVEMHETKMAEGMMKMIELESLEIPEKSTVELKPGGKHLMLITPVQPLQIGDNVEIVITFADETTQSIMLEVKR